MQVLKTIISGTKICANDILNFLSLNEILNSNTGFEISEDVKCWQMDIKPIRIIIPNNCQVQHILTNDALGQLLIGLRAEFSEQTFINNSDTYIYVADILPEYLPILESEPLIIIENK